jgi:hypothetical protein
MTVLKAVQWRFYHVLCKKRQLLHETLIVSVGLKSYIVNLPVILKDKNHIEIWVWLVLFY